MVSQFATANELATIIKRTFNAEEIAAADLLLQLISGEIQRHTGQHIELVTDDHVTLHGNYGRQLVLPQWPVIAVSAVSINGNAVAAGTWTFAGNILYRGSLPVFNGPDDWGGDLSATSWWGPLAAIAVTYTHGFATIPDDVRSVCLRAGARALERPEWASTGNYYQRDFEFLSDDDRKLLDRLNPML